MHFPCQCRWCSIQCTPARSMYISPRGELVYIRSSHYYIHKGLQDLNAVSAHAHRQWQLETHQFYTSKNKSEIESEDTVTRERWDSWRRMSRIPGLPMLLIFAKTTFDVISLYSTVVVRVTCNDEVLGSIPSGGIDFCHSVYTLTQLKRDLIFFLRPHKGEVQMHHIGHLKHGYRASVERYDSIIPVIFDSSYRRFWD